MTEGEQKLSKLGTFALNLGPVFLACRLPDLVRGAGIHPHDS
jgi:hypothetical protein